jgi:hypothetical protein
MGDSIFIWRQEMKKRWILTALFVTFLTLLGNADLAAEARQEAVELAPSSTSSGADGKLVPTDPKDLGNVYYRKPGEGESNTSVCVVENAVPGSDTTHIKVAVPPPANTISECVAINAKNNGDRTNVIVNLEGLDNTSVCVAKDPINNGDRTDVIVNLEGLALK